MPTLIEQASDRLSAPLLATAGDGIEVVSPDEARFMRGPRAYRVRGLARALSAEALKVTLRLSLGERLHLDTLDLYQARWRPRSSRPPRWNSACPSPSCWPTCRRWCWRWSRCRSAAIRGALQPEAADATPALTAEQQAARAGVAARPAAGRAHRGRRGSDRRGGRRRERAGRLSGDGVAPARQAAGDPDPVHQRRRQIHADGWPVLPDAGTRTRALLGDDRAKPVLHRRGRLAAQDPAPSPKKKACGKPRMR